MTENENNRQKSTPPRKPSNRPCITFAMLSSLIAIVALIATGWCYQQFISHKNQLANQQQTILLTLANLKEKQSSFEQQVTQELQHNATNLAQLLKQTTNLPAESALSQAQYLVQLAQLNLSYANNLDSTKEQLHMALAQINNFNTPAIEALRNNINLDLQALDKIPTLNKQTLLNDLDELSTAVKNIPILPETTTQNQAKIDASPQTFWEKVKYSLEKLKGFVVIQRVNDPSAYALTPEKKLLTKQLILIKLTQAQWAVLNLDQTIYQQSLSAAKQMLLSLSIQQNSLAKVEQKLNTLLEITLHPKNRTPLKSLSQAKLQHRGP